MPTENSRLKPTEERPSGRVFLHVDMDAFYAAVEQREYPEYRGKPVVVGAPPNQRGVVSTASYEARRFGIHSAMPSRDAYRRCPHAIFLPVRMSLYKEVSEQVFRIFHNYTPWVEGLSIDEAFLDVTGAQRIYGDGPTIARKLKADILAATSLTCSVGVASNKFLAKLASEFKKPDGLTVIPFDQQGITQFLRPLPTTRIWGVGRVMQKALDAAAIYTIGDVQDASLSLLQSIVGQHAARHLRNLAFGVDLREIEMDIQDKSISREHTYLHDEKRKTCLEDTLFELVQDVARRLRADGRYATTGRLKIRWDTFDTWTRQRPFPVPTRTEKDLQKLAKELLDEIEISHPVRLIGFGVIGFEKGNTSQQLGLFDEPAVNSAKLERLEKTVDQIRNEHGVGAIRRARTLSNNPKRLPPRKKPK